MVDTFTFPFSTLSDIDFQKNVRPLVERQLSDNVKLRSLLLNSLPSDVVDGFESGYYTHLHSLILLQIKIEKILFYQSST